MYTANVIARSVADSVASSGGYVSDVKKSHQSTHVVETFCFFEGGGPMRGGAALTPSWMRISSSAICCARGKGGGGGGSLGGVVDIVREKEGMEGEGRNKETRLTRLLL